MGHSDYVIITPARDEASHLRRTIQCVAAQSARPAQWIIVNDGSKDRTAQLIDEATGQLPWITAVHRSDRGMRHAGAGVMEAFYAGVEVIQARDYAFLVKLDGDLTFAPDYFEHCLAQFATEPRLGIGGGLVCNEVNGELRAEAKGDPLFHVRGATKIYRLKCWQEIGGLIRSAGWDTIDEFRANMLGWTTRTFRDIPVVHHRHAGAAYGTWSNWTKNGRANYIAGYDPAFMAAKCISRALKPPYLVGAFGLLCGFLGGYLGSCERGTDPGLMRYVRREQRKRLLRRPSLWDV